MTTAYSDDGHSLRAYHDALDFIEALFRDADDGYVAFSWWPPGSDTTAGKHTFRTAAEAVDGLNEAWQANNHADLYVRLTTVREVEKGPDGRPRRGWRGGAGDTLHGFAIPFDLDISDGWDNPKAVKFCDLLTMRGLQPSVVIGSGHGWHGYLLYDEPLDAHDHGQLLARARVTFINVANQVQAGLTPDTKVYDTSRVMRIPGSTNVKYPDYPLVSAIARNSTDFDRRYGWSDFDELLDPLPEVQETDRRTGGADNDGTPGHDFRARVDAVDVITRFMPGCVLRENPETGDVFITRPDRNRHGIVRYGDDGHVAVYSSTTVHSDLGVPAGSPDDRDSPWWADQLLCFFAYGGDFSRMARDLAAGNGPTPWDGQKFGKERDPAAADDEYRELLAANAHHLPGATSEPRSDDRSEGDTEAPEDDWGPGWIELTELLDVFGFRKVRLGASGMLFEFYSPHVGFGTTPVAATVADGTVKLHEAIRALPGWTTAPAATPLDWRGVLRIVFGRDAAKNWRTLVSCEDETKLHPLLLEIRGRVQGVDGLGDGAERSWDFTTLADFKVEPPPPTLFLQRDDGQHLIYDKCLNVVYGASESGKTWLLAEMAKQAAKAGYRCAWFDLEEPYRPQIAHRIIALGGDTDVRGNIYIPKSTIPEMIFSEYGSRTVRRKVIDQLIDWVVANEIRLVVIDSLSELAGSQNLDDNRKADLTFLRSALITPLTRYAAVVMIDHTNHASGPREGGSAYKRTTLDGAALYVAPEKPFMEGQDGSALIYIMKDRHSQVRPHAYATKAQLTPDSTPVNVYAAGRFTMNATTTQTSTGIEFGAIGNVEAVTEANAKNVNEAMSEGRKDRQDKSVHVVQMEVKKMLVDIVNFIHSQRTKAAPTTRLIRSTISGKAEKIAFSLDLLAEEKVLHRTSGTRGAILWRVNYDADALVQMDIDNYSLTDAVIEPDVLRTHGLLTFTLNPDADV